MRAKIYVKYKQGILDPEGSTVASALDSMDIKDIDSVSIGKYIEMKLKNTSKAEAEKVVDESCRRLLANPNTETYSFEIIED